MENYNGKIQSVRRRFDSLQNFVGRNEVYSRGDILCVSTKNDNNYNVYIDADGVHSFIELYNMYLNGDTVPVVPNHDGKINTFDEIVAFLESMPEGTNLKEVLDGINTDSLTDEEREALDALVNSEEISEDEIEQGWQEAMQNAGLDLGGGTQEAGAGEGSVDGGGADLDD